MTPSPIVKALSLIQKHRVRYLLIGGQACILYGAIEFSNDLDLAVLAEEKNLDRLLEALGELRAELCDAPFLSIANLERGLACRFRCRREQIDGIRIDIMSRPPGCDSFPDLWERRKRIKLPMNGYVNVLSLPDVVRANKTQRDKDWPRLRSIVEVDFHQRPARPSPKQIAFWLFEGRSVEFLVEVATRYKTAAGRLAKQRPLLRLALDADVEATEIALRAEEDEYRAADREYWKPLKEELFEMRQQRRRK